MEINPFTLSFKGELEKEYIRYYTNESITQIRIAFIIGVFYYGIFGVLDHDLAPDLKTKLWTIRYLMVAPAILFMFGLTFIKFFKKHLQILLGVSLSIAGFGVLYMISIGREPINYTFYIGLIVLLAFGYTFVRARFITSAVTGTILLLLYQLVSLKFTQTPVPILINNNFFFMGANIFGMMACYALEYNNRKGFYTAILLEKEKEQTRKHNIELEKIVEERTKKLHHFNNQMVNEIIRRKSVEEELVKEKELAEISNYIKNSFMLKISHELKPQINKIINLSKLIANEDLETPGKKSIYNHIVKEKGDYIRKYIKKIIDFAKIEVGEIKIVRTRCHIEQLLLRIYDTYVESDYLQHKPDLVFKFNISKEIQGIYMYTDEIRLEQVISILVNNAIQHTNKGFIELCCEKTKYNEIRFHVKDTGIGMTDEQLEQLFSKHYRLKYQHHLKKKEFGLGLLIAKGLVDLLDGIIHVKSVLHKGSEFNIYLPIKSKPRVRTIDKKDNLQKFDFSNKNILIAENNEINFKLINEMLSDTDAKIIHSRTGKETIELFKRNNIDLILINNDMSDMEGNQLIQEIRKIDNTVTIMVFTEYSYANHRLKNMKDEHYEYVTQPIDHIKFLSKINWHFNIK